MTHREDAYRYQTATETLVCVGCGALVAADATDLHDVWHGWLDRVDELLRQMYADDQHRAEVSERTCCPGGFHDHSTLR